ncbi:MAG: hypothetical protein DMF71_18025 [Acidobacteria bacterium]|nr:MAG: hypothetical protein DMF71_18025 [Acidobacteriota bacterium]
MPVLFITAAAVGIGAKYQPRIDPSDFQSQISNPYFPLVPGTRYKYVETVFGETFNREITVTSETKTIMGVKCVSVHDVLTNKGEVREDTYDWYAQDKKGAVWYFGEATIEIKPGRRRSSAGSWEAGVGGALPGIVMPAKAKACEPYQQEYYPNWAEDPSRPEHLPTAFAPGNGRCWNPVPRKGGTRHRLASSDQRRLARL